MRISDWSSDVCSSDLLEVIAVNFKEDRRDFNAVIRANKDIDLRYIRDPKGRISDSYGVNSLPNMFIVDVDGKVAHVHRGYSEEMIDGFIQEMLALLPPEPLAKPANGCRRRLQIGRAYGRARVCRDVSSSVVDETL